MYIRKSVVALALGLTLSVGSITYSTPVQAQTYYTQNMLKTGFRGNMVKDLQLRLKNLKYFRASTTGYYGPITTKAVKEFQKDAGLYPDGVAGPKTLAVLDKIVSQDKVKILQTQLKNLNYFHANITGYYGSITKEAVKQFQRDYGLHVDGIAGPATMAAIQRAAPRTSRGSTAGTSKNLLIPWFGQAEKIFKNGAVATITDVDTGLQYRIKRICGYNHADVETLTAEDTRILLKTYGGQWSWQRRAVIVNVNGVEMAASIAAMPHAGREDQPYGKIVSWRSGGYGKGANLDGVKNNNMSGVVDLHFYQSKTHGSNRVEPAHQRMVLKAAKSR